MRKLCGPKSPARCQASPSAAHNQGLDPASCSEGWEDAPSHHRAGMVKPLQRDPEPALLFAGKRIPSGLQPYKPLWKPDPSPQVESQVPWFCWNCGQEHHHLAGGWRLGGPCLQALQAGQGCAPLTLRHLHSLWLQPESTQGPCQYRCHSPCHAWMPVVRVQHCSVTSVRKCPVIECVGRLCRVTHFVNTHKLRRCVTTQSAQQELAS